MLAQTQKSLDPALEAKFQLVLATIKSYPAQVSQAWDEVSAISLPDEFKNVQNVIVSGMGGSALGARVVDSLAFDRLRVPLEIFTEYSLPNYANENTLVVVSSYSGNTEETLTSCYNALSKKCKVFGITTGGKLAEILEKENLPRYVFDPKNNPSKQPRMAIGYATCALLALLSKMGLVSVDKAEIGEAISKMQEVISDCDEDKIVPGNLAKSYAKKIYGKIPVLVASEHLLGAAFTIKNTLNESSKTFACLFDLPEANHHLMEGLRNPTDNKKLLYFVFFNSNLYSESVKKRYPLTAEVVGKNGVEYSIYSPFSDKKISQIFSVLAFGSLIAYYLTKEYALDPLEIPWVDYFKSKLSEF